MKRQPPGGGRGRRHPSAATAKVERQKRKTKKEKKQEPRAASELYRQTGANRRRGGVSAVARKAPPDRYPRLGPTLRRTPPTRLRPMASTSTTPNTTDRETMRPRRRALQGRRAKAEKRRKKKEDDSDDDDEEKSEEDGRQAQPLPLAALKRTRHWRDWISKVTSHGVDGIREEFDEFADFLPRKLNATAFKTNKEKNRYDGKISTVCGLSRIHSVLTFNFHLFRRFVRRGDKSETYRQKRLHSRQLGERLRPAAEIHMHPG